jgi:hypothetical protein
MIRIGGLAAGMPGEQQEPHHLQASPAAPE